MLQFLNPVHGTSLDSLQYVHVSLILGSPELDTVLQVWPPVLIEVKDRLPQPAGTTLLNAAKDTIYLPCRKGTSVADVQLGVHQEPPGYFLPAAFQLSSSPALTGAGVDLAQVQDFALPLVELCEVPLSPFLQPDEVLLDSRIY